MTRFTILLPLLGAVAVVAQTVSPQGCYSSAGSMQSQGTYIYQSLGYCAATCGQHNSTAMALQGSECYCGNGLPPASNKVDDARCTTTCPGYPDDSCGGDGYFSVSSLAYAQNGTAAPPPAVSTGANAIHSTITSTSTSSGSSTSSTSSTTVPPSYTGAAASAFVGGGALAMGALAAFL